MKTAKIHIRMTWYDWMLAICFALSAIIGYGIWLNGHFKRKGIKTNGRTLPYFGHMWNIFTEKEHFVEAVYKTYNKHKDQKYVGFYAFRNRIIILRDLELIKQIGVKEFDNFIDHRIFMDEEADPLFGKNLFFLRGQKWRDMRASMSPAFTGSKMKNMFPMMIECADQVVNYFKKKAKEEANKERGYVEIEMKDISTRYTNDVIASTAFGYKVNSLEDQNNDFYNMGKKATDFSGVQFLKFLGYGSMPRIMKFFKIPLFSPPVASFFRNLVHGTMEKRQANNIIRPDMIHLLMLARQGSLKYETEPTVSDDTGFATINKAAMKQGTAKREWTDDDLTAQAMAFLLAGFDTASSLICFMSYELALHPEIQSKLQEEIDQVMKACDGQLSYTELMKMKYVDMVVSESLRKWPPDTHLDRLCNSTFTLPPPNDSSKKPYVLTKGHDVWIPTYSIHHDPQYHPNPDKFDPERFSDENKQKILPFTFIPFGIGPRFCIGARFSVLEAKVIIVHLLANFDIVTTPTTTIPIQLARNTFIMHSKNGFWLGLKIRQK